MDLQESLTAEVERVVSAPYAVCLQNLYGILIVCQPSVVHAWADASTCQLVPLAKRLRKAFDTWEYTLEIFERLALARPFRDAFLAQYPSMLDAFLQKAIAPEGSSAVTRTCIAMLSEPLPESIPLPLLAQDFFMRLFDGAVKSTDEHQVSVVHTLLNGACRDLLGVLPENRVEYIEQKGYELLKNSAANEGSNEDRHRLTILCLGFMGILVPTCEPQINQSIPMDSRANNVPSVTLQRVNPVRHLEEIPRMFQTKAARATIRLAVTLAISILSSNTADLDDDVARYLKIVAEVLAILPSSAREKFLDDDAKYASKLIEKVLKAGSYPGIQLQGLRAIAILHDDRKMPEPVVLAYTRALLATRHLLGNGRAFDEAAKVSLPLFAAQLPEDFLREFLCCSIEAIGRSTSRVGELKWLQLVGKLLGELAQETPVIRCHILSTLSSDRFQSHLQRLLSLSATDMDSHGDGEGSCRCRALASSVALGLETCSLLLRTAIVAQTDEVGMDTRVGLELFQKQQDLASFRPPICQYSRPDQEATPPLSLLQEKCTPHSQSDSRDWRGRLAKELELHDRHRLDLIERKMGEVCRDLEARCEQVEEPLRLEEQKVQELEEELQMLREQHGELSAHVSNLENREIDREFFIQGLEVEKAQAEQDCQHASDANDGLTKKAEDLQRMLDDANQTAERTLASARQDYDRMKSELRALLTKEETRCEEQAAIVDQMKVQITSLETELDSTRALFAQERDDSEELRAHLENAMQHIEEQKTAKLQAQAEVSDLLEKEAAYIDQLRHAQAALIESHGTSAEIKADHDAMLNTLTTEMESMRNRAESDLQKVVEEASKKHQAMDSRLQLAMEEMEGLMGNKESLSAELQAKETQIGKLQHRVEKIAEARDIAEAKSEELELWRNNILSAMGAPAGGILGRTTTSHRQSSSRPRPASPPRSSRRRTFAETEIISDNGLYEDPDLTESERTRSPEEPQGSPERSITASPTPKRAKVLRQQPFKPPMLKGTTSTSLDARRRSTRLSQTLRASTAARKPLSDVSTERGNMSPMRKSVGGAKSVNFEAAPASSARGARQTSQPGGGSFDVTDFLESTPFTPSGRHQQRIENFGSEDTTVDV